MMNRSSAPRLPAFVSPLGRRLPVTPLARLANPVLQRTFATAMANGDLDFLGERELVLHVDDAGLETAFRVRNGVLCCVPPERRDVCVSGPAAAFILLAAKRVDADMLFFQRVLVMHGDTELGLGVKYLLDAMPVDAMPRPVNAALQALAVLVMRQFFAPMPGAPRQ